MGAAAAGGKRKKNRGCRARTSAARRRRERKVNNFGFGGNVLARHRPDEAAVGRVVAVVAHYEVTVGRDGVRPPVTAGVRFDERLVDRLVVPMQHAVLYLQRVARAPHHPLDEQSGAGAALSQNITQEEADRLARRHVAVGEYKRDYLARARVAEVVHDFLRQDVVADEEGVLVRAGRDDVGLDHPQPDDDERHDDDYNVAYRPVNRAAFLFSLGGGA